MKRMITASVENPKQLPITKLTEDELRGLPEKVLLVTRRPGTSDNLSVFKVVTKERILENPDKCLIIDSHWGYAQGRDIYLASKGDVEAYKKQKIAEIEDQAKGYMRYAL